MRSLIAAAFLLSCGAAGAQQKPDPTAETVRFLRDCWSRVRKDGPKALERVKTWPEDVRKIEGRVSKFGQTWIGDGKIETFQDRLTLMGELWRIRGSIGILGLLQSETLEMVTGLDAKEFRALQKQFASMQAKLPSWTGGRGVRAP